MRWPLFQYWQGYWNMGQPMIPLPGYVVMTDRANGARYYLGHTGTTPALAIALVPWDNTIRLPFRDYGSRDGPYLNLGTVRLFITSGVLTAEDGTSGAISDPRVFTRRAFERRLLEITAPLTWKVGDALVFTETTT